MPDWRLCFVTNRSQCGHRRLEDVIEGACRGGLRAVQLRDKEMTTRELFDCAAVIREITARSGATMLINGRVDIALAVDADGIHSPERDAPALVPLARQFLDGTIGISTHSVRAAVAADDARADYVVFGPIFETESKRGLGFPQGLDKLRAAVDNIETPVIAIGGITPERAARCMEAGAAGVAVISAIARARNIADTLREFRDALGEL